MSIKYIAILLMGLLATIYLLSIPAKAQTINTIYNTLPDIEACNPGVLNEGEKQAVLDAFNSVRALHQLAPVVYDANDDDEVAQASLMIVANNYMTHYPSASARCYSQTGYDGSSSSNLMWVEPSEFYDTPLLQPSTNDIGSWLIDKDVQNLRHRRWLLDPFLYRIAYGRADGPPDGDAANRWGRGSALKVYYEEDDQASFNVPNFIAYPFGDYPLDLFDMDWYWSFSVVVDKNLRKNNGAVDYSSAEIEVYGAEGGLTVDEVSYNAEKVAIANFLQWKVTNAQVEQPYQVRIRNVRVQGKLKDYEYTVKITKPYYTRINMPVYENPANGEIIKVKSGEAFAIFAQPPRTLQANYQTQDGSLHLQTYVHSPYVTVFRIDGAMGDELSINFSNGERAAIRLTESGKLGAEQSATQPAEQNAVEAKVHSVTIPPSQPVLEPVACTRLPTLFNMDVGQLVLSYQGTTPQIVTVDSRNPHFTLLDDTSSIDSYPTWSPDGRQVAFRSQNHLFVMDADGSNRRQLSTLDTDDSPPSWSPDGGWVAFSATPAPQKKTFRFVGDPTEIYIIQADGNNLRRMTADTQWDSHPVWSPLGNLVAYTSNPLPVMAGGRDKPSTDLMILDLLSGSKTKVHLPDRHIADPVWSPTGTRLAFISKPIVIPVGASGAVMNEHLHLIDAAGGDAKQLTPDDWRVALPNWSPDGHWLAFAVLPDFFDNSKKFSSAYIIRMDGACGEQIAKAHTEEINALSWSPYDAHIALVTRPNRVIGNFITTTIEFVDTSNLTSKIFLEQATSFGHANRIGTVDWRPLCAIHNNDCLLPRTFSVDAFYQVSDEAVDALAQNTPVIRQPSRPASAGDPPPPPQASKSSPQPDQIASQPVRPLAFCLDEDFDAINGVCNTSQTRFTGIVKLIRVSWSPIPELPNATFKRVWYLNGVRFLEREDTKTYAHIEVATRSSLATGRYRFELYVKGQLVESGEFEVQ